MQAANLMIRRFELRAVFHVFEIKVDERRKNVMYFCENFKVFITRNALLGR